MPSIWFSYTPIDFREQKRSPGKGRKRGVTQPTMASKKAARRRRAGSR